jgi:hypothetical protein
MRADECLFLVEKRPCSGHNHKTDFDPSLASAANFCCDAQRCPLGGFGLNGNFA